ncbi:MAG: adenosylcobinamide-GDP ribazoletransferase [Termitinemataceae bacterium]
MDTQQGDTQYSYTQRSGSTQHSPESGTDHSTQSETKQTVSWIDQFLSVLTLVSRIPFPHPRTYSFHRMDFFLPLTAPLSIFLFSITLFISYRLFQDLPVAVLLALTVQYLAFNLFHFDGFVDTADAFLGSFNQEKRRAILKDSRIGVYGLWAGCTYLGVKFLVLLNLFQHTARFAVPFDGGLAVLLSILIYPLSGRIAAALIPGWFSGTGTSGLGSLARDSKTRYTLAGSMVSLFITLTLLSIALILVISMVPKVIPLSIPLKAGATTWPEIGAALPFETSTGFSFITGFQKKITTIFWSSCLLASQALLPVIIVIMLSSAGTALWMGSLYRRGLGGYTGDCLGAAVELGELVYLMLLFFCFQQGFIP